jgi:hypothetical protein
MLGLLDPSNEVRFLDAIGRIDISVPQNLLQLFDGEIGKVFAVHGSKKMPDKINQLADYFWTSGICLEN